MSEPGDKQRLTFFPLEDHTNMESYENIKPWISIPLNNLERYTRLDSGCPLCEAGIPKRHVP